MTKRKNASSPASGSVLFIPLNKLKKSPRNARKTPHTKAEVAALAASIKANGILQNPVVEPETNAGGKPTGFYLVTIGEGRRQAQLLRAKKKEIAKDEPIRCVIDTAHNALEISLAENAIRAPMHPADQFEAFFELHRDHGMNAEDIAARFGVTPAVVKQRLKLATVSPRLIELYRKEEMNLDQLTAYAITDDHAKQEAVWEEFGASYEREDILATLNGENVAADDRRAVFVGFEAYQKAGGTIIRDLFDEEHQGYLTDRFLLDRLAAEKLEALAGKVRAEGWKWVEVAPRFDHSATADMRRVYPQPVPLTKKQMKRVESLEQEYEAIDPDADNAFEEGERIEQQMAALQQGAFDPADVARAGGFVSLGSDGEPRIECGFIRIEDDDAAPKQSAAKAAKQNGEVAPLSEKLVAELTAHRTLALRDALGVAPDLALSAIVHALAAATFFPHSGRVSCIKVSAHSQYLSGHAPGIEETPPAQHLQARHERFESQMPEGPDDLWAFVRDMETVQQLALLAHCVSLTVDAVKVPKRDDTAEAHADQLFQALDYDMASVWTPTAANYLGRVSKERILEAVREGVSKEAAANLASMKKQAMAEAAEQRLKDRRWLPPVLRTPAVLAMAAE
ncbi:MAG: ParB family transcriptional regulator, chromosome partitioning protein [Alphaproteobacteria bacterium]|jgi:ParB family chromosome partitioning protein|nr:ParB family transcriptional regulator, chromosome partitioning protein [Alphaproteobacteria bacterium]